MYSVSVTSDDDGLRIDRFLADDFAEFSRSFIQKMIVNNDILVNGSPVKASYKVQEDDLISITEPAAEPSPLTPEDIPLDIVYEDDDVLAVNKQAGLPTHPAVGHRTHTLVNALLWYLPNLPDADTPERPGIVHRLDMDTSGIILVAKNSFAMANLNAQFQERTIHKKYWALVFGGIKEPKFIIDRPIGRNPKNRQKMCIDMNGKEAKTTFEVLDIYDGLSFVEASPHTGRTHQIRVHLASIGHPIVSDETYGKLHPLFPRQFLHAHEITFKQPHTQKEITLNTELPDDLNEGFKKIKGE